MNSFNFYKQERNYSDSTLKYSMSYYLEKMRKITSLFMKSKDLYLKGHEEHSNHKENIFKQ